MLIKQALSLTLYILAKEEGRDIALREERSERKPIVFKEMLMALPETILTGVAPFRPLFPAPTWRKRMTVLTGTLLAHGRRTVCSA